MKKWVKFFDKLEDVTRQGLSRFPIFYALIGGVFVVLFWRGVWHTADLVEMSGGFWADVFSGPLSTLISTSVLLLTGLLVSVFIGDRIILSGLKHEKKLAEKTEADVQQEESMIIQITAHLDRIEKELAEVKKGMHK